MSINVTSSSGKPAASRAGYVMCVDNAVYLASLEIGKVYRALPNRRTGPPRGWLRVIDESGEDYLFPPSMFVHVQLPPRGRRALALAK